MTEITERSFGWKILSALPKETTLYTILRHVSASGMTRWLDVVFIDHNNEPRHVRVLEHPGYLQSKEQHNANYKIKGAGMDIGFDLVYSLGLLIHDDGYYFDQRWL